MGRTSIALDVIKRVAGRRLLRGELSWYGKRRAGLAFPYKPILLSGDPGFFGVGDDAQTIQVLIALYNAGN